MKAHKLATKIPNTPRTPRGNLPASQPAIHVKATACDPVQVYCRIRPLVSENELSCIRVENTTTVVLTTPKQAQAGPGKQFAQRELQYFFKRVFEPQTTQHELYETVALPLVENLLQGRNSLLFTYGVSGSGKTFTMTGDLRQQGIMQRCLHALFHTISGYQTKKCVFKPDHLNGFEILSEAEAEAERMAEKNLRCGVLQMDIEVPSQTSVNVASLQGLDEDNMFAVFVTYIEVYNNSVYDLLEPCSLEKMQSKIVRADPQQNMFVHGVTEVEIKSVEEAMQAFQQGQRRKHMAHTVLNADSSRSHSVFNIRLVQAPTDYEGEQIVRDKRVITVSQLSLVDLAGSERNARTQNTGLRLREAGNINNSLMTLRTCLEYLRENQQASHAAAQKKVPYRDSKITHLFKNYFDGNGQVSMIVCVNPRLGDFEENAQVMRFAELTQEVQTARSMISKPNLALTPGRAKANKMLKTATIKMLDCGDAQQLDMELVYTLGSAEFPHYELESADVDIAFKNLTQFLEQRIEIRKKMRAELERRCDQFASHLEQIERENKSLRTEIAVQEASGKQAQDRVALLENELRVKESAINALNNKIAKQEQQIQQYKTKVQELEMKCLKQLAQKEPKGRENLKPRNQPNWRN